MRDVRRFTSASAALLDRMIDGYGRRSETNMRAAGVARDATDEPGAITPSTRSASRSESWDPRSVAGTPPGHARRGSRIAELALRNRLPSICPFSTYPAAGGLMAYGPDFPAMWRQTAGYVDRILKRSQDRRSARRAPREVRAHCQPQDDEGAGADDAAAGADARRSCHRMIIHGHSPCRRCRHENPAAQTSCGSTPRQT